MWYISFLSMVHDIFTKAKIYGDFFFNSLNSARAANILPTFFSMYWVWNIRQLKIVFVQAVHVSVCLLTKCNWTLSFALSHSFVHRMNTAFFASKFHVTVYTKNLQYPKFIDFLIKFCPFLLPELYRIHIHSRLQEIAKRVVKYSQQL